MKEDKLGDLSMKLSVEVLKLTKEFKQQNKMLTNNFQKLFCKAVSI